MDIAEYLQQMQFGDFSDNLEALVVFLRRRARGEKDESGIGLRRLREQIVLRGDPKSIAWLLPAIDGAIGRVQ